MRISYKERVARRFTLVTAIFVSLVFGIIYLVVQYTVTGNVDRELKLETEKHVDQIFLVNGEIRFVHKDEWEEQEHSQIQLNPIFIEIVDMEGNSMDRSPNLDGNHLGFYPERAGNQEAWTLQTGNQEVRQMQIPLNHAGKPEGYMLVAKSFEDARKLLTNLRNILLVLYPGILIPLFFSMRYLAGESIAPIREITRKTNQITQSNLNERVPATVLDDEIGQLTLSINELLARLEKALIREKQFTSDASHELRTPLAVLRGTLEVLIRKQRTPEEYVEKIRTVLSSIDRMSEMIDQLLSLARGESGPFKMEEEVELLSFLEETADQKAVETGRVVLFQTELPPPVFVMVNERSLTMIVDNLIQNALKYSSGEAVVLEAGITDKVPFITVKDKGIGISEESLARVFDPFYRDKEVIDKVIPGTGLGLAIVRKLAQESSITIEVESIRNEGTQFRLLFKKHIS